MAKFLVDSNIFIEAFKGNKDVQNIVDLLLSEDVRTFISINSLEEIVFILIKAVSNSSYWDLKKNQDLVKNSLVQTKDYLDFILEFCEILEINKEVFKESLNIIEKYGLLPNDALILATCKYYEIPHLLSLDKDFREACNKESINLIDSVKELKEVLNKSK